MTTKKKTIALFGAGSGLGASLARRFGRENYHVVLVARRADKLQEQVAALAKEGVEASGFPADLSDLPAIPALVRSIEEQFGAIDAAVYAPISTDVTFIPAADLDVQALQPLVNLYTYAPIQLAHTVLQGQLDRGDGAIVFVNGLTAAQSIPGMSGFGPAMAAARNYIHTLNAEVGAKGVYAGSVVIGAFIKRSASFELMAAAGGDAALAGFPIIDPDDIAEEVWNLVTKRDRTEVILPALSAP